MVDPEEAPEEADAGSLDALQVVALLRHRAAEPYHHSEPPT